MTDATPQTASREDRIRALVEETIAGSGMYVVDITIRGRKGSQVVDVYLDREGDLSVDDLARVSREVGFLLDAEDLIAGRYNLNVSSPGADRPLTDPRQYRKHVGRRLRVHLRAPEDGAAEVVEGELAEAGAESIDVRVSRKETRTLAFADIDKAHVLLPW